MGLISILSDLGSIGSTTKWAINLYQDLKSKNKKITDSEIFQMMMIIRYKKIELAENGPFGITDSYKFLVYRAQIAEHHAGLTGIIIDILHIEADLWKNDLKSILKMLEPLTKRMSEAKISKETKYGPLEKFEVENTLPEFPYAVFASKITSIKITKLLELSIRMTPPLCAPLQYGLQPGDSPFGQAP